MIFEQNLTRERIFDILRIAVAVLAGLIIAKIGFKGSLALLALPFLLVFIIYAFRKPQLLLYMSVAMGFLISLLSRYVPGIPFGLSVDGLLGLLIIVLIFRKDIRYKREYVSNVLSVALLIWTVFSFVELFNPLAKSRLAWFYANRGLSFYPIMLLLTSMAIFHRKDYVKWLLIIWAGFSVFGTVWGIKQLFFGVSAVEQQWLNAGAASTHILFGKLRIFSYYSDAAQFGASQAHTGMVFGIIGLYGGKVKLRWIFLAVGVLSLYGMLISGTRGALGVVALGGFTYFLMTKNFRVVLIGVLAALGFFVFLRYTSLLQSNYQINRLRTALNADDPSLKVRQERERILSVFMSDKPFGGGIGSAGYWGKRFSPGTFLAELGTDGHYTRIWMETGIVGLWLYFLVLVTIIFYLGKLLWSMRDSLMRQVLVAFYSGFLGLCLASYTNGLLTQIPTGNILFVSLAIIYLGAKGHIR